MYLIFDTETTGLPKRYDAPLTDFDNWPRCIQIAWQLHDDLGNLVDQQDYLVQPDGFDIPYNSEQIHGISTELAQTQGVPLAQVLERLQSALKNDPVVAGHNIEFDLNIMGSEYLRAGMENPLEKVSSLDTASRGTANLVKIPGGPGGNFKFPKLDELHRFLFQQGFEEAHNATADVEATTRCFLELIRIEHFSLTELRQTAGYFENYKQANPEPVAGIGLEHQNLKAASAALKQQVDDTNAGGSIQVDRETWAAAKFSHLHNHSQFSVLQSTMKIDNMVRAAAQDGMPAVALTDLNSLMGAFRFTNAIQKHNKSIENDPDAQPIKGIIGLEVNLVDDMHQKEYKDLGYQIVLLARNKNGYQNLIQLSSTAQVEGFYYVPRIDREFLAQYSDDLILLTGNEYGEVPKKLLNVGQKQAEEALVWYKEHFPGRVYVEINRHNKDLEARLNPSLIALSRKHNLPLVATNNTFYLNQNDANAHDILLCLKDNEKQTTPIGQGRGYRYGMPEQEYWFKPQHEMKALFRDLPEAILNTQEIVDQCENYDLARKVLLPKFDIPAEFLDPEDEKDNGIRGEVAYLAHLSWEGAKKRYGEVLNDETKERIQFELDIITQSGYPGYFLITWDFIKAARDMGVAVGPGRGSAAGSVVAYCLWITNADPIAYDLLFERFLNPERISMPDIDIDFEDTKRHLVMEYVVEKYGADKVCQIITYGKMAAKSSIKDTARVLDLPLHQSNQLAGFVPDFTELPDIFEESDSVINQKFRAEDLPGIVELRSTAQQDDLAGETLRQAQILEGTVKNMGVHACGVIITPDSLTKYVPVTRQKGTDMVVTQFDNNVVEDAGLLKMDFLGLKTLSQIKDTCEIIKDRLGLDLDPEEFPLDDEKTYELFQRGDTVGIFQYESPGMQKHMKALKPTVFSDLIAMNALYRPGPLAYIPNFIARKHGTEEIEYPLPIMEKYLKDTYGITVYQEQVMLLSQQLANFTKGQADTLRKAMGKKQIAVLDKMKPLFLENGGKNGHDEEILLKIWSDWEKFAQYAFNKSHSTCYALIAFQTAYLKAHYPAEFLAATLSNNMDNIALVTKFMDEAKRMQIPVLGPDVNESRLKFTVNKQGAIRFGMGGVKGLGTNAALSIMENRSEGPYKSIFDMAKRVNLRSANKKAFEALAVSGGFDSLSNAHRAQYFSEGSNGVGFLDNVVKYAQKFQENRDSAQVSLFGESSDVIIPEPEIPPAEEWGTMETLKREREVVGIYISGHPLDDFKMTIKHHCNTPLSDLNADLTTMVGKEVTFAGVVSSVEHRVTKMNKGWAMFTLEDYTDSYEAKLFNEDYLKFRHFLIPNSFIYGKAVIQEGWMDKKTGQPRPPRLKFTEFRLLHDVMKEESNRLELTINIKYLNKDLINQLWDLFQQHEGDKPIRITLLEYDKEIATQLDMRSGSTSVDITDELLHAMEELPIGVKVG